ncbi:MAG TPA: hypothetical protein V6D05_12590 [Stenomitos sp.]
MSHHHQPDPEQWARMRREVPTFIEDVIASAVRGFRRGWSGDRPRELPAAREGLIVHGEQAVGRPMEHMAAPIEPERPTGPLSRRATFVIAALVAVVAVFGLGIALTVLGFVFSLLSGVFGLLSGIFGLTSGVFGATSGLFAFLRGLLVLPFVLVPVFVVVFALRGRRGRRLKMRVNGVKVKIKEYY